MLLPGKLRLGCDEPLVLSRFGKPFVSLDTLHFSDIEKAIMFAVA